MSKNVRKGIMLLVFIMLVSACGEKGDLNLQVTEEIYEQLEETVTIEEDFEAIQLEINELEKQDQALYDEMTEIGNTDLEQLTEMANEAIGLLEERIVLMNEEKEVFADSKAGFLHIESLMEKLEDDNTKEIAGNLYDAMMDRYDAYDTVYEKYTESITTTEKLYTLFKDEQFDEESAYSLINEVNNSYDEVIDANEIFNDNTVKYNQIKKELYDILNEQN